MMMWLTNAMNEWGFIGQESFGGLESPPRIVNLNICGLW